MSTFAVIFMVSLGVFTVLSILSKEYWATAFGVGFMFQLAGVLLEFYTRGCSI